MTTIRAQLRQMHVDAAQHCVSCAKGHATIAGHHRTLQEALGDGPAGEAHGEFANEHDGLAEVFTAYGETHTACAKDLDAGAPTGKAMGMSGDEIMPDSIVGTLPDYPRGKTSRPVPRYGQPEINKAGVPDFLHKFVEVGTEE